MVLFLAAKSVISARITDQVQIDFDNENDDFCDENSHIFYDYGDENDQKTDKYHGLLVKLLGKKRTKTTGQGSTPSPPKRAMPI